MGLLFNRKVNFYVPTVKITTFDPYGPPYCSALPTHWEQANLLSFICIASVLQFTSLSFYVSFLSRVKMNLINWPAPNVWVFTAQLVEKCSANAEATGQTAR